MTGWPRKALEQMSLYYSVDDYLAAQRDNPAGLPERIQDVLDRLNGLGRRLDAVRFTDEAFAHHQAEAVQTTTDKTNHKNGAASGMEQPLAGVPLAHKELYGRAFAGQPFNGQTGWPDEGGSLSCEGQIANQTARVIEALDKAGAVDCGRLVSVEYALGVTGHNAYAGTPKNPWNPAYICGGSSSGSGAVVAAGIVPAALGSDTGGSIRLPAAACGLVGIKPTQGLVSRAGVFALSTSLDTVGPLSRSVRDGARVFSLLTGYDSADKESLVTAKDDYLSGLEDGLDGLKIGLAERYFLTGSDTEVADPVAACFERCARLGAICCDVEIDGIETTNPLNVLLIATEAARLHKQTLLDRPEMLNDQTLMRILTGAFTSNEAYQQLQAARADFIARTLAELFERVDMFMTPVWPFMLPTITDSDVGANPEAAPLMQRIGHNTRPVNFLGLPAVCLPIGFDSNGLPLSVQLVGKPFSEAMLLRAARAIERDYEVCSARPDMSALS